MSARVWLPRPGVVLAHRATGYPLPAGHVEAVEATHYACKWLWTRRNVQPCHSDRLCDELATVRVQRHGWRPHYYCERHTPIRPAGETVPLCSVCAGPLDSTITEGAHPTCAPHDGSVTEAAALVTLLAAFPDCEETTQ